VQGRLECGGQFLGLGRLELTNVALIAVGWGVLAWLVPPYASSALPRA
jgi:hypothetical protein